MLCNTLGCFLEIPLRDTPLDLLRDLPRASLLFNFLHLPTLCLPPAFPSSHSLLASLSGRSLALPTLRFLRLQPFVSLAPRFGYRDLSFHHRLVYLMSQSSESPAKMKPTLFQLPPELLHMIFSMLPEASQGCLALTCKTYYTLFKSVFRDRFFDLGDIGIDLSAAEGSDHDTLHTL